MSRDCHFEDITASDAKILARNTVIASGVIEIMPEIPGLRERWGRTVLHCPYCHGYEFGGQALGVLVTSPLSSHQLKMIPNWGPTTQLRNGWDLPEDLEDSIRARDVTVEESLVEKLVGDGDELAEVILSNGTTILLDAIHTAPEVRQNSTFAADLGCELGNGIGVAIIEVVEQMRTSSVGIYAVGDCARWPSITSLAATGGVVTGSSVSVELMEEQTARLLA